MCVLELEFLGNKVMSAGIQPMEKRVEAIGDFPTPTDKGGPPEIPRHG